MENTTVKPTFGTLDEIYSAAGSHQITAHELLNGRSHVFGQWQDIEVGDELRAAVVEKIVQSCGGRNSTKEQIRRTLKYFRGSHWALSRFFVEKYHDRPAHLVYCAGQDMTWEMKNLRDYLRKI